MDLHGTVARRLARANQRYTTSRRALVASLQQHGPCTMRDLLDRNRRLRQSTAYRSVALLEELGVVVRLAGSVGEARFELAEPFVAHHHHVVCTGCGAMADFRVPDIVEAALHQLERDAARAGFNVSGHRLDFVGTCGPCLGARVAVGAANGRD